MRRTTILILAATLILLGAACAGQEEPVPEDAAGAVPPAAEAVEQAAEEAVEDTAEALTEAGDNPIPPPVREVAAEAEAAVETAVETAKEKVTETVAEAAARIEVPVTVPGATRIGATKCKMCHRVQYDSWADSSHAGLDPVLDCESCHGPGSLYKKKSVMENRELAIAAGLVLPESGFCTENCHTDDWDDDMLAAAHEHKQAS